MRVVIKEKNVNISLIVFKGVLEVSTMRNCSEDEDWKGEWEEEEEEE